MFFKSKDKRPWWKEDNDATKDLNLKLDDCK